MSRPKFANDGTTYSFTWDAEALRAEVSRLRARRDGRLTCRILWTTTRDGREAHLWQKDGFNLSAGNNALNRRELADRYKAENIDWTEVLEQVCVNSVAEYERGEPMVEIIGDEDVEKPAYVLKPFLVHRFPSVLFGDPSSLKTTLALELALTVILPWYDNPLGLEAPETTHRVAFLDWETGREGIEWQWRSIQAGAGLGAVSLYYRRCHAPLADDLDSIREYLQDNRVDVIIIDSLALAAGGELKDTPSPLGFFRALGVLDRTSLSLAHTPKERDNRTIYGNRFFEAEARNTWEIVKQQDPGTCVATVGLKHRKPLPWDRVMPDMAFNVRFSDNGAGTAFTMGDPTSVDDLIDRLTVESRIVALLKEDGTPRTPAQFATELGKPAGEIRQVLFRVMRKPHPKLVKMGDRYGLAAYQPGMPEGGR